MIVCNQFLITFNFNKFLTNLLHKIFGKKTKYFFKNMAIIKKIKIIIVDDHELIRKGLVDVLSKYDDFEIVGLAEDGDELLEKYFELKPDLILTDVNMPKMNGTQALMILKKKDPKVKALFLSVSDHKMDVYDVFKAGGMGLINKSRSSAQIIEALRVIHSGKYYFLDKTNEDELFGIIDRFRAFDKDLDDSQFTAKELFVLRMIANRLTNEQIAEELKISVRTVEYHRKQIKDKLGFTGNADLINYAYDKFGR